MWSQHIWTPPFNRWSNNLPRVVLHLFEEIRLLYCLSLFMFLWCEFLLGPLLKLKGETHLPSLGLGPSALGCKSLSWHWSKQRYNRTSGGLWNVLLDGNAFQRASRGGAAERQLHYLPVLIMMRNQMRRWKPGSLFLSPDCGRTKTTRVFLGRSHPTPSSVWTVRGGNECVSVLNDSVQQELRYRCNPRTWQHG